MNKLILQIAHALLRVCQHIKQEDIRSRLESHGVYFAEIAANLDTDGIEKTLSTIEHLVFLAEEIGEIEYYQGQTLHKQFNNLRRLILEDRERKRLESAIEDIFSGDYEKHIKNMPQSLYQTKQNFEFNNAIGSNNLDARNTAKNEASAFKYKGDKISQPTLADIKSNQAIVSGSNRQDLIADKVGQLGKAAMKDIIAAFPDVSERTLRYDLQKLTDRHILERTGSGGPASFYTLKNNIIARDLLR